MRIVLYFLSLLLVSLFAEAKDPLKSGWYLWDPYQYILRGDKVDNLTGLDVELSKNIIAKAGSKIEYEPVSWDQHIKDIASGARDMASGATYTKERAEFAYFSEPYRFEENSLFIKNTEASKFKIHSVDEMLALFSKKQIRVGVITGYVYASPEINNWIRDPNNQHLVVGSENEEQNLEFLTKGLSDCFLADRAVGATVILERKLGGDILEIGLNASTPINFMFSKKTITPEFVERVNKIIRQYKQDSEYQLLVQSYLYPVLLMKTIHAPWFRNILILGTISFALSGVIIAWRIQATFVGAMILAILPSMGGGIIRDLLYARKPVGAIETPHLIYIVSITVVVGFIFFNILSYLSHKNKVDLTPEQLLFKLPKFLVLLDAIGLASFTVIGVAVAVYAKIYPLWLWGGLFSVITGAGGGILRDLFSGVGQIESIRGRTITVEACLFGGIFLSLALQFTAMNVSTTLMENLVLVTIIGCFLSIITLHYFKIPALRFNLRSGEKQKEDAI